MADFEAKLDEAQAVMISHMRGHTSDMDAIMALSRCRRRAGDRRMRRILWVRHGTAATSAQSARWDVFQFQSYKLVNAGEGGIMITDDPELAARAIIMSGAYEQNWKKHPGLSEQLAHWQNKLPLYNLRMQNSVGGGDPSATARNGAARNAWAAQP
jgi:perosamine synthetase